MFNVIIHSSLRPAQPIAVWAVRESGLCSPGRERERETGDTDNMTDSDRALTSPSLCQYKPGYISLV